MFNKKNMEEKEITCRCTRISIYEMPVIMRNYFNCCDKPKELLLWFALANLVIKLIDNYLCVLLIWNVSYVETCVYLRKK